MRKVSPLAGSLWNDFMPERARRSYLGEAAVTFVVTVCLVTLVSLLHGHGLG